MNHIVKTYVFENVHVRVIIDNDKIVWFQGTDINRALELKTPRASMYNFSVDKPHLVKRAKDFQIQHFINQEDTLYIAENGLTIYLLRSHSLKVEKFSDWINEIILPSTRKVLANQHELFIKTTEEKIETAKRNAEYAERDKNVAIKKLKLYREEVKIERKKRQSIDIKYRQMMKSMRPNLVFPLKRKSLNPQLAVLSKNAQVSPRKQTLYTIRGQKYYVEKKIKNLLKVKYPNGTLISYKPCPNPVWKLNYLAESGEIEKKGNNIRLRHVTRKPIETTKWFESSFD